MWVAVEAGKESLENARVAGWLCLADVQPGVTFRLSRLSRLSKTQFEAQNETWSTTEQQ